MSFICSVKLTAIFESLHLPDLDKLTSEQLDFFQQMFTFFESQNNDPVYCWQYKMQTDSLLPYLNLSKDLVDLIFMGYLRIENAVSSQCSNATSSLLSLMQSDAVSFPQQQELVGLHIGTFNYYGKASTKVNNDNGLKTTLLTKMMNTNHLDVLFLQEGYKTDHQFNHPFKISHSPNISQSGNEFYHSLFNSTAIITSYAGLLYDSTKVEITHGLVDNRIPAIFRVTTLTGTLITYVIVIHGSTTSGAIRLISMRNVITAIQRTGSPQYFIILGDLNVGLDAITVKYYGEKRRTERDWLKSALKDIKFDLVPSDSTKLTSVLKQFLRQEGKEGTKNQGQYDLILYPSQHKLLEDYVFYDAFEELKSEDDFQNFKAKYSDHYPVCAQFEMRLFPWR
uniref:Endonuclease/exonuclease/phosphatase domain-containing protein n=1 Tax=Percolomonas cosmopolitus TaxID=63605 RepID=A0A7S1KS23_9EUKA